MEKPPVLPPLQKPVNTRLAYTLNLIVPGGGQLLQGQIILGIILAFAFMIDFSVMLVLFLKGFVRYLELVSNGRILQGDNLEQIGSAFHVTTLLTLLGIGLVIHIISFIAMSRKEASAKG
jgi:hypothetical protein